MRPTPTYIKTMNCLVCLTVLAMVAVATATRSTTPEYEPVEGMEYTRCVDITDIEPCKEFPDRFYDICDACHLGFMAHCMDGQVTIKPCEITADPFGNKLRKIFDSTTQTCLTRSSTCPTA